MMRKLWLVNKLGQRYDLSDPTGAAFLSQPEGLGAAAEYAVARTGQSELMSAFQWSLVDVTGVITFTNNRANTTAYSEYRRFIAFCAQSPLELHYQTPDMTEENHFVREVVLIAAAKGELTEEYGNALAIQVIFHPLSMWRSSSQSSIVIAASSTAGKVYAPNGGKAYPYHYSQGVLTGIRLLNRCDVPVGVLIEVNGTCTNPVWSFFNESGAMYGRCKLTGTFDYVLVDSRDISEGIALKQSGSFIANAAAKQDLSVGVYGSVVATFVKAPPGVTTLNFSLGGGFTGAVAITMDEAYATV